VVAAADAYQIGTVPVDPLGTMDLANTVANAMNLTLHGKMVVAEAAVIRSKTAIGIVRNVGTRGTSLRAGSVEVATRPSRAAEAEAVLVEVEAAVEATKHRMETGTARSAATLETSLRVQPAETAGNRTPMAQIGARNGPVTTKDVPQPTSEIATSVDNATHRVPSKPSTLTPASGDEKRGWRAADLDRLPIRMIWEMETTRTAP